MYTKITLLLTLLYLTKIVNAEGSKELLNGSCSNNCYIVMFDNNDSAENFATYNCPYVDRLNIRCKNGDKIYFGYYDSNGDVYYRLKNPNGTVVMGPTLVKSTSASGWISSCTKLITGPSTFYAGGYAPLSYTTTMAGDYYIEFAVNNSSTTYSKRLLWFDITVQSGGSVVKGRVWSEKWDLNTNGSANPFMGNLFVYTNDSVVTEIKGNSGMLPYGFTVACNSTGASNVGSITQMRKSDYTLSIKGNGGTPSAPAYAIFVNNPDSSIFPTGSLGSTNSVQLSGCSGGSNCVMVNVSKKGYVDITLTFANGSTVQLATQSVVAGDNCIAWNGLDGNGNAVANASNIQINVNYERGLTNLPYGDVEKNTSGIMIALIRPTHDVNGNVFSTPLMFWDDSLLNDPLNALDGEANLTGCTGGCHKWTGMGANNANLQIINTWWYITQQTTTTSLSCPFALPLTLINFLGEDSGRDIVLHWTAATASQLKDYDIERSINESDFVKIGSQKAHSSNPGYCFNDTSVAAINEAIYYRLKQVDDNNMDSYSKVVVVNYSVNNSNPITIFPDPNNGKSFSVTTEGISNLPTIIKLFSTDGRLIALLPATKMGTNKLSAQFGLSLQLSPGLYIVECVNSNGVTATHMVVY